jgi:N4-gp56 family major capsid protein
MGTTTSTVIAPAVSEFYDRTMLVRALPLLVHDQFGQRRPLPPNNGRKIKFRRYNSLPLATAVLSEGIPPPSTDVTTTEIEAIIQQYGAYVEFSDLVSLLNVEPVLTEIAEVLGEQSGQSLDVIYRDILVSGTNVQYANGNANRGAVIDLVATADFDKAIRTLNGANSRMFTSIIKAGTGVGSSPIRPAYWGIVHPDVQYTLDGLTGFKSVETYASQNQLKEGEIGAYKNIRFISTTNAKIWTGAGSGTTTGKKYTSSNCDVYGTIIFAQNAYGITELRGNGLRNIVKALGSAGVADPLEQKQTSGWKAITALKILNDTFMLRLESAAAA